VGNNSISIVDYFGLFFADGGVVERGDETSEEGRKAIANGAISVRSWTVILDGRGSYDVDPSKVKQNSAPVVAAAEAHEKGHIASIEASDQSHAIPHKQVFCFKDGNSCECFYWTRRSGTLERKPYIAKNDSMLWVSGTWPSYSTWEEWKTDESREYAKEIATLKADQTEFIIKRIGVLETEFADIQKDTRMGKTPRWSAFKKAHDEEKLKPGFYWLDPSKVYEEFK